ncbi:MAG: helix-turn-helix transcriptional regulator [Defluviitaleaceae bacterium]|nr:helix-turn-helix transcriptional regulator [Defluviitaleaceae bacterium]
MANYNVGSLIKRLRKQKGLTQEELAFPIIDRATLSKIESGKVMPNNKTLENLLEKLGFAPHKITDFFHDEEMADALKILNELDNLLTFQTYDQKDPVVSKIDDLIQQLENNEKYMQNELNRQNILILKATNAINKRSTSLEVRSILSDAIKITIPTFNIKNIRDYYLSKQDRTIISRLAVSYSEEGKTDKAVDIMYELKLNFDNHCIDNDEMGREYPTIIMNLARYLGEDDRLNEAIEVCDVGIKVCIKNHNLYRLPFILWLKAATLGWLGKAEESKKLFTQIVTVMELFEMHDHLIGLKEQAKVVLGIDL